MDYSGLCETTGRPWLRLLGIATLLHLPVAVAYFLFCEGPFFHLYIFALAVGCGTLVPGLALLSLLRVRITGLSRFVVGCANGVVLLSAAYYLLAWGGLEDALLPILIAVNGAFFWTRRQSLFRWRVPFSTPRRAHVALTVVVFGIFGLVVLMHYPSGRSYDDGLRFYGTHAMDSVWHIARIGELSHTVPPRHPLRVDAPMKYHVLLHAYHAALEKVTGIGTFDLFFRLVPTLIFPLLALAIYVAIGALVRSRGLAVLAVVLMFTAGDLAYTFVFRKAGEVLAQGGSVGGVFAVHQRGDLYYELQAFLGNHFNYLLSSATTMFGFLLLFAALRLFIGVLQCDAGRAGWIVGSAWLFAALIQTKIQLGAVALFALFVVGAIAYVRSRDRRPATVALVTLLFAGVFAIPIFTAASVGLMESGYSGREAGPALPTAGEETVRSALMLPGLNLWRFLRPESTTAWLVGVPLALLCMFGVRLVGLPAALKRLRTDVELGPVHGLLLICIAVGVVVPFVKVKEPSLLSHFIVGVAFINCYFAIALWHLFTVSRTLRARVVAIVLLAAALPMWVYKVGMEIPSNNLYGRVTASQAQFFAAVERLSTPSSRILRPTGSDLPLYRDGRRVTVTTGEQFLQALARRCVLVMADKADPPTPLERMDAMARRVHAFYNEPDAVAAQQTLQALDVSLVVAPQGADLPFNSAGVLQSVFTNRYGTLYKVLGDNRARAQAQKKESNPWSR